jgi:exodeoxyribonuclease V beta subunit
VLWWTSPSGANRSALARVLFARDAEGRLDPEAFRADKLVLPPDDETAARLAPLVEASGGTISLGVHGRVRPPADRWTPPSPPGAGDALDVARLERHLDRSGRRWSFTAISAGDQHRHDERDAAPEDPTDASGGDAGAADEGSVDEDHGDLASGPTASHLPALATLPAGATFGTLVHSVLEHVDFSSDSLAEDLRAEVLRQLEFRPVDLTPRAADGTRGDPEAGLELLVQGLFDALDTPMGELLGDRRLRDWSPADRLDELDFDLRLGSGHGAPTDAELGALIESHLAPADLFDDQPLHDWAATLVGGRFDAVLAGHLTGSIDAVLRMPGDDGEPRFVVVDYKTNRLTPRGASASSDDYAPPKLVQAMAEHHYPLQALLYSVALHRYLRWRQPGYDPAVHLGGVAYLFVRGMVGATTPVTDGMRHGAFTWKVPTGLVVELSDLLAAPGDLLTGADR